MAPPPPPAASAPRDALRARLHAKIRVRTILRTTDSMVHVVWHHTRGDIERAITDTRENNADFDRAAALFMCKVTEPPQPRNAAK